jgi:hypothetical protein
VTVAPGLRFCDQTGHLYQDLGKNAPIPFRHEFKVNVAYAMPWGLQAGVAYISYAGDPIITNWVVPASVFAPVGGRTQSVNYPLESPGTDYLPRWGELDLSVKKMFHFGKRQTLEGDLDFFNLPNASTVLTQQVNFGPTLGYPTSTVQGRFFKIGGRYRF